MLRVIENSSSDGAKSYYSSSDYYSEGQELDGVWHGKGASRLGLQGRVDKRDWDLLCENKDPRTRAQLTPRQNANRRVGYDINFHVPKSVSLVFGLTQDQRILDAFQEAVAATMADMESEMQTRVRVGGKNEDRTSGNMLWGEFVHFTARPVGGVPDPHLHAHCFVFNTTWDETESRWKAGQFAGIKRDAPYFEALYHSRLAKGFEERGFSVERTRRGWELSGVPRSALPNFSRRTAMIEAKARADGITDPKAKSELGAKTRSRKKKNLSMSDLRADWRARLTDDERAAIDAVVAQPGEGGTHSDVRVARDAVVHALGHCFERGAVATEREVLREALKRSIGEASPEAIIDEFNTRDLIRHERGGQRFVTTREVLANEEHMVAFAREGRGRCSALASGLHNIARDWLNADQRRAVEHVLSSNDRVMLVRGAAGVGKTSMMHEAIDAIEASGKRVFVFAPSAEASRGVLREVEGFSSADTVARLLLDKRLQEQARGQVIWIDEAGLLGVKSMGQVFDLAKELNARIVLSGDRAQHGSVERGGVLKLLEVEAGILPAEIREIQRQKGEYKSAVKALSEGRVKQGVDELDKLGWIREVKGEQRYEAIAKDYVKAVTEGKTALVVSPTNLEGTWITREIRDELRHKKRLGKRDRTIPTLESVNLTEAERADAASYAAGDVLVFHQNAKGGITKGTQVDVQDTSSLPLSEASKFQVYRHGAIELAKGDLVRVTRNGKTADGKHALNNGSVYTVKRITRLGDILLTNGWKVTRDFGHLAYGYVSTSHASQGKTVQRVFIGQSEASARAASKEQFYVSVSRGKEQATIYTDDKEALLEAVSRSTEAETATEFARERVAHLNRTAALEVREMDDVRRLEHVR